MRFTPPLLLLRAGLLLLLTNAFAGLAWPKESWVEVRSPNFTIISNGGEKDARKVADQFEQFREVFHYTFPNLRVELGKPLIIFAVKNEDSLKILLPAYWIKGHAHPAGIYVPGEDRHFVAVRTDIEGPNPYEVIYHEYTHAIMNLNFRDLPIWLGEGLAELFGNSVIHNKDVEIGKASGYHLKELQQGRLIPIDVLLQVDGESPYYNEQNRVSIFYAECWAIVHYLLMDPEAKKRQLLSNFLNAWNASDNQVQAAQTAFGDLKTFSQAMEAYARRRSFYVGKVNTTIRGDPKSYSSRELPPAEVAANRALFYIHTQRPLEANTSIDEALQADPKVALAYEARGLLAYSQQQFSAAEEEFEHAIELNSSSYFVYYFDAESRLRRSTPSPDQIAGIIASLEKAKTMNPQFAPVYAALATVYSLKPETHELAFLAGLKSVKLEPGNLSYAINFGHVLLNVGKTEDAKKLAERIEQAAKTQHVKSGAESLSLAVADRESYDKKKAQLAASQQRAANELSADQAAGSGTTSVVPGRADTMVFAPTIPPGEKHRKETEYAVEGTITAADCNPDSSGRVILTVNHAGMKFLYASLKSMQVVSSVNGKSEDGPDCSTWKGKRARLYFYQTKDKPYAGELETIQFF
jgi:tetratricopeptide (TPR) repeat protein